MGVDAERRFVMTMGLISSPSDDPSKLQDYRDRYSDYSL